MNSGLGFKLKKFLTNKNTITIVGVVVIIALLYLGYNKQVQNAVEPIEIPIASMTIQPKTEITNQMISYISVPSISISSNVLLSSREIIGKYTSVNAVIPQGSMFFRDVIVSKENLPDFAFSELEEGQVPVFMEVDIEQTYGNSIYPGNKIDIYMKGEENGKVFVGKLVQNVKVLTVKDSSGQSVFENLDENRVPSSITYGVPKEIFMLILKASYINNVELKIIPQGGTIAGEGVQKGLEYLEQYITSQTVNIEPETNDNGELIIPNND